MSLLFLPMNALPSSEVEQSDYRTLFSKIKRAGFSGVEIRKELLSTQTPSVSHIKQLLEELELLSIYSVPQPLYNDTHLRKNIHADIEEAKFLRATKIKFSLGHFNATQPSVEQLQKMIDTCEEYNIQILVENDQTAFGGKSEPLQSFFQFCQHHELNIAFCCDLGNWCYVGEEEKQAIVPLLHHAAYIHLKEVHLVNNQPHVISILENHSYKWKRLLKLFSKELPIAFEFPVQLNELSLAVSTLTQEV